MKIVRKSRLATYIIHCKYPFCHHLSDVHLHKFCWCVNIRKACLIRVVQVQSSISCQRYNMVCLSSTLTLKVLVTTIDA